MISKLYKYFNAYNSSNNFKHNKYLIFSGFSNNKLYQNKTFNFMDNTNNDKDKTTKDKIDINIEEKSEKKDNKDKGGKKGKEKDDKKSKIDVKVVKGARDFVPIQMSIRNKVFNIITSVFKRHGAVEIDTPVFELKETLTGKYGEESKLIYDLQDQGGELLSLRYDLTVPFARYMVTTHNQTKNQNPNIKRFHIGKVYRRDSPQTSRGRFREFFQCDFDIAGNNYGRMIADAEVVKVVCEILNDLKIGEYNIKINHRKILDATVALSGIPDDKFKVVCSSVDKLDKEPWDVVRKELLSKEISEEQADKLWTYVQLKDKPWELYKVLMSKDEFLKNDKYKDALEDMRVLFEYCDIFEITHNITFDLSLARGLDYYTGLIYEAVLTGSNLGSIAGGGRYDELVGMFSSKPINAVGVSIGVERVFSILEEIYKVNKTYIN